MQVRLLSDHWHAGAHYPAGAVIDIDQASAAWLSARGLAEPAKPDHSAAESPRRERNHPAKENEQ